MTQGDMLAETKKQQQNTNKQTKPPPPPPPPPPTTTKRMMILGDGRWRETGRGGEERTRGVARLCVCGFGCVSARVCGCRGGIEWDNALLSQAVYCCNVSRTALCHACLVTEGFGAFEMHVLLLSLTTKQNKSNQIKRLNQ